MGERRQRDVENCPVSFQECAFHCWRPNFSTMMHDQGIKMTITVDISEKLADGIVLNKNVRAPVADADQGAAGRSIVTALTIVSGKHLKVASHQATHHLDVFIHLFGVRYLVAASRG